MSAHRPSSKTDSVPSPLSEGDSGVPTARKPSELPSSPSDSLDGCLWPVNRVLAFARNPLKAIKIRWATYSPKRLLARGVVLYFIARGIHAMLEPWYLREVVTNFYLSDSDFRWALSCIVWLASMVAWFAIVQMIWAGLRLIADAIRSTRRANDDRPAGPPASKS